MYLGVSLSFADIVAGSSLGSYRGMVCIVSMSYIFIIQCAYKLAVYVYLLYVWHAMYLLLGLL